MARRLPATVFRNDRTFRRMVRGPGAGLIDCGFLLKPDGGGGYDHRVMADYVGVYVLRGRGVFTDWQDRTHRVAAGAFIQHPPHLPHGVRPTPDGRWAEFYFMLPASLWDALLDLGTVSLTRPVLQPGLDLPLVERFERLLQEVRHGTERDAGPILARVHELLATVYRLDGRTRGEDLPHAAAIDEARAQLTSNLDKDVSLQRLARQAGLSYERFRKLFRQRVGVSPGEYRIRRRIDQARHLMALEAMTSKQVAYALGYPDPFTFSKQFHKYVGMSPSEFRARL